MSYDSQRHHRRSIRLKGYDYRQPGAYFITICTQDRACLFGTVVEGEMHINDAGRMVQRWWDELNRKFHNVQTDAFVIMPNHIHGIIIIHPVGADLCVRPENSCVHPENLCIRPENLCVRPKWNARPGDAGVRTDARGAHTGAGGAHTGAPLPEIVRWLKTMTTNEYIRRVKNDGWTLFRKRLWQRNYYDHIIRNDESLNRIRRYIVENPLRWHLDRENPDRINAEN